MLQPVERNNKRQEEHTVGFLPRGHDFRPAYLSLSDWRTTFPNVPIIAVTATATTAVRTDIVRTLRLRSDAVVLCGTFNRPNIAYEVCYKELLGKADEAAVLEVQKHRPVHGGAYNTRACLCMKNAQDLATWLQPRQGQSGIVYCARRETVERVATALRGAGLDAAAYHAGKDARTRAAVQRDWSEVLCVGCKHSTCGDFNPTQGALEVVVATIAFGMGIDMPACRFVVHFNISTTMEGLLQARLWGLKTFPKNKITTTGDGSCRPRWLAQCGTRLLQVCGRLVQQHTYAMANPIQP